LTEKEENMKTNISHLLKAIPVIAILLAIIAGPAVSAGSGPGIWGIWEQDHSPGLENGDLIHALSGAQFVPSCVSGDDKAVTVFAVIDAGNGGIDPSSVKAVIEYPAGPQIKTVLLSRLPPVDGSAFTKEAKNAGLIRFNTAVTWEETSQALGAGTASVWRGETILPHDQVAGDFNVTITGTDTAGDPFSPLVNSFRYLPVACLDYDFSHINYGESMIGQDVWVKGDDEFGTDDRPSVRNSGNYPARVRFVQDDMGLGKSPDGAWNVAYGVRVGDNQSVSTYEPEYTVILPDPVGQGSVETMDFSINVHKGSGSYSGYLILTSEMQECNLPDLPETPPDEQLPVPEFPFLPAVLDYLTKNINC